MFLGIGGKSSSDPVLGDSRLSSHDVAFISEDKVATADF